MYVIVSVVCSWAIPAGPSRKPVRDAVKSACKEIDLELAGGPSVIKVLDCLSSYYGPTAKFASGHKLYFRLGSVSSSWSIEKDGYRSNLGYYSGLKMSMKLNELISQKEEEAELKAESPKNNLKGKG
jgi:hypothetical protein